MINNFQPQNKKNDIKFLLWIVLGFLFVAWLCTPPGNKFLQICFWGNNTKFLISKVTHNAEATEYIFHRNNAVYLAKMYKNKKKALKEMDRAIETIPTYIANSELESLYKDRANIRLMAGDYKGALNDFLNSGKIDFTDYLKVAMLFKEGGNYRAAMSYCNAILDIDNTAYAGYACLSELYTSINRPDLALNVWNLAVDRKPNLARGYVDRAFVKKQLGDLEGYNKDIAKAKEVSPTINIEESIIEDTLHPKILTLTIR